MPYTNQIMDELNILSRYNLNTTQEGIKVHASASVSVIEATKRLFDKGLLSQDDGGYLTSLGREAAEHAQNLLTVINNK